MFYIKCLNGLDVVLLNLFHFFLSITPHPTLFLLHPCPYLVSFYPSVIIVFPSLSFRMCLVCNNSFSLVVLDVWLLVTNYQRPLIVIQAISIVAMVIHHVSKVILQLTSGRSTIVLQNGVLWYSLLCAYYMDFT